jgi:predicted ATPase/DNA-binding SARP family transcriptional activator
MGSVTEVHSALRRFLGRTMHRLSLNFLGAFEVAAANRANSTFRTDKVRALLVYLALEAPRPQQRDRLAAIFWPERDQETARYNLRLTLHRLRQTLEAAAPGAAAALFHVTRSTIHFHPVATQVDVLRFQQLLAECETHPHQELHECVACVDRLQQAAELYRGELLAGFGLADAPAFEEWLLLRRETLQQQALLVLQHLATAHERQGHLEPALAYAHRKLALDPYREETHRQIMRLLARQGWLSQALAQYGSCRRLLREEVGSEPDAETVALAEQIRAGKFDKGTSWAAKADAESRAMTRSTHQPAPLLPNHNLPAPLTPLVGRERELSEIMQRLQDPNVRLLTIVGAGGMGKTRLALAAARRILDFGFAMDDLASPRNQPDSKSKNDPFADGLFFVSLAPLHQATELTLAVADALQLQLQGSNPQETLYGVLRNKALLLVLDNFEHLLPPSTTSPGGAVDSAAVQLVVEILQRAPAVKILVTSRQRLNVRGEHVYRAEGLTYPLAASLGAAVHAPAVQLFCQSVRQVEANFALTEANLPQVLHICQSVQGMPLGLEMAAAWADRLPLAQIADQIEQSADFLTVDWADAPRRQRSMRAVFDWSWQLLSAAEQQVLRRLAIFRGGFTLAAAAVVADASASILAELVQKSLLRYTEERYELHELLRQFAEEQIKAAPAEYPAVSARHSDFFLAFVAARTNRLARHEPRQAANEIRMEINNIRQAWLWAVNTAQVRALEQSAYALWQYYILTGSVSEADHLFQLAGDALETSPLASDVTRGRRLLCKLLAMRAYLLNRQSRPKDALACAMQAVAIAQRLLATPATDHDPDPIGKADTQEAAAIAACMAGLTLAFRLELEQAKHWLAQALAWIAELQQGEIVTELAYDTEWMSYLFLGGIYRHLEQCEIARTHIRRSVSICHQLGKVRGEMNCLGNLGAVEALAGNYGAARQSYERLLPLTQALGYRWAEGTQLSELGMVMRHLGNYGMAQALLERGRTVIHEVGDAHNEIFALAELARLYAYLGSFDQAQQWLDACNRFLSRRDTLITHEEPELAQVVLALQQADYTRALAIATQALALMPGEATRSALAQTHLLIGHAAAGLHQWAEAASAYQQALALYTEVGKLPLAVEAHAGLASIALHQGDLAAARDAVIIILPLLDEYPNIGIDEPFYTYWVCIQVLTALADLRATSLLQQAYQRLQHYASLIDEESLRHSFWEKVPVHRAIVQAYTNHPWLALAHPTAASTEINGGRIPLFIQ